MLSNIEEPKEWRYERKFVVPSLIKQEVVAIIALHPAMFTKAYDQRLINNIYLDTADYRSYFDNVDGLANRIKVRIRWYGSAYGKINKPVLELKIKNGTLGAKKFYPLTPFYIGNKFDSQVIIDTFNNSDLPELLRTELKSFSPLLFNNYTRDYFLSADKNFRITIDSKLSSYKSTLFGNTSMYKSNTDNQIILELKYDADMNENASKITKLFPFRMTKSSKYVTGIERLFSW